MELETSTFEVIVSKPIIVYLDVLNRIMMDIYRLLVVFMLVWLGEPSL
jgi:hypothetical protein